MTKDFWRQHPRPILALAPMDGYTDSAFRRVCKTIRQDLIVFTEFTSTDGFHFAKEKVGERFRFSPDEQPVVAQIFGNNPVNFIEAAQHCEALGFSGIDINMGCPARHVVKSEQGVALRASHDKAFAIVEAVAQAVSLPVSVKTRLGMTNADDLVPFGQGLANAGANLITIHARTYAEPYGVPANWEPVYELQKNVDVPVIGNGGISSLVDGHEKIRNLAGCMIGQAALGNPWIFSERELPPFAQRVPLILQHVLWLIELKGFQQATLQIRKHLIAYAKGVRGATTFRSRLARVTSVEEIQAILQEMATTEATIPDLVASPA